MPNFSGNSLSDCDGPDFPAAVFFKLPYSLLFLTDLSPKTEALALRFSKGLGPVANRPLSPRSFLIVSLARFRDTVTFERVEGILLKLRIGPLTVQSGGAGAQRGRQVFHVLAKERLYR